MSSYTSSLFYYVRHHWYSSHSEMSSFTWPYKWCTWFFQKPTLYGIFSFLRDLEVFKHLTTILSEWNALGSWQVDWYVHIHFKFHKPVQCMSCSGPYMHALVGPFFSAWKTTLQNTVVQKLILRQNWHSTVHPFNILHMENWFQQLFGSQTYH